MDFLGWGKLAGLDLFTGIGGLTLALAPWVEPVAYCDNDPFAQEVLLSRMRDGGLPSAPIWDDVRTLSASDLPPVDIVYGGFPCQDVSVAGSGGGLEGERSGLFWEIVRLLEETRAAFVFLENVPALRSRGAEAVGKTLARLGYDCRWGVLSAAEFGAPHLRKRWFLLAAHPDSLPVWLEQQWKPKGLEDRVSTKGKGFPLDLGEEDWWSAVPELSRVDDGVSSGLDARYRALGNAVVPLQARVAFMRLAGLDRA